MALFGFRHRLPPRSRRVSDSERVYGRRFVMRETALGEAAEQRERLQKAGWTAPVTIHPAEVVTE
jgi:hypothetical protein